MAISACSDDGRQDDSAAPTTLPPLDGGEDGDTDGDDDDDDDDDDDVLDVPADDGPIGCDADADCQDMVDLLFVIDNSGSMAEEQLNLSRQFDDLIVALENLEDGKGNVVGADVNIMVTTTDMWNPSCQGEWVKEDYDPAKGRPIHDACTDRPGRFLSFEGDDYMNTCTDVCSTGAAPMDPFIHFDQTGHNVVGGSPADALSCIGPQGVDGCGYEAPLESMIRALNPGSCWNDPEACTDDEWSWVEQPFLRDGAVLAIVMLTDEADCSVKNFEMMSSDAFLEGEVTTSAACWNAGVECTGFDAATGTYAECHSVDREVDGSIVGPDDYDADTPALQQLERYTDFLQNLKDDGKQVLMLGILGVPEVTAYSTMPPVHPIEGGVHALEYREWNDADILPGDPDTALLKTEKFGIGPGCTGFEDASETISTGQAIPPVRIKEVCESLDEGDEIRCCIESICGQEFSAAIECLTGIIQDAVVVG